MLPSALPQMFRFEDFFLFCQADGSLVGCNITRLKTFCCCIDLEKCFSFIAVATVIEAFASLLTRQLFNAVLQIILCLILINAWKNNLMVNCDGQHTVYKSYAYILLFNAILLAG